MRIEERLALAKKKVKAMARGEIAPKEVLPDQIKVTEISYAYERRLAKYLHKPSLKYVNKAYSEVPNRAKSTLLRAANEADRLGVDYDTYMDAQFYWFDRWFRRHPKIYEIAGGSGKFPTERRVKEYLQLKKEGKIKNEVSSPVVPVPNRKSMITPEVIDKINRQRLADLCRLYDLTEKQCLDKFGSAGLFDSSWLKKQQGDHES